MEEKVTKEELIKNQKTFRKDWKKAAKKVVKGHYLLLVMLCLISVFYGVEFNYVTSNAEGLYNLATGQEVTEPGKDDFKLKKQKTQDVVYEDVISDQLDEGKKAADQQLKKYEDEKLSNKLLGRKRGALAQFANSVSSGHFYLDLISGLNSVFHSDQLSVAAMIILALALSLLFWVFFKNVYQVILRRMFLESRLYKTVPVSHMLHLRYMRRWIRASLTVLLTSVFYLLWSLTIVGAVIKTYSYMMVPFIVAENPDIKPREAIKLSREMMNGHKMECFIMDLSFLGWILLGIVTFGFADVLWGLPYRVATYSECYAELRQLAKENNIENADKLTDKYLFEKGEEDLIRYTYRDIDEQRRFVKENAFDIPGVRGFILRNFTLWLGSSKEKEKYDNVEKIRYQIREEYHVIQGDIYPQRLNPGWTKEDTFEERNIRFMRTYTIWSVILVFFLFGFIGWAYEVTIHLVKDGIFINRGALHGPWLPVYGGGVAMILVILARFRRKPQIEVIMIIVLCGIVEYFTSLFIEMSSGLRYWDYTGYFLNLDGRICAEGLLVFAIGGSLAVYLVVPILDTLWSKVNAKILAGICVVLLTLFVADMIYTHYVPNTGKGITDYDAYKKTSQVIYNLPGFSCDAKDINQVACSCYRSHNL